MYIDSKYREGCDVMHQLMNPGWAWEETPGQAGLCVLTGYSSLRESTSEKLRGSVAHPNESQLQNSS